MCKYKKHILLTILTELPKNQSHRSIQFDFFSKNLKFGQELNQNRTKLSFVAPKFQNRYKLIHIEEDMVRTLNLWCISRFPLRPSKAQTLIRKKKPKWPNPPFLLPIYFHASPISVLFLLLRPSSSFFIVLLHLSSSTRLTQICTASLCVL